MRTTNIALAVLLLSLTVSRATVAQGPGFRGGRGPDKDFAVDRNDFHFLLEHHDEIRREVKELDDGVETVTESDNAEVAARIQKHVAAMYRRVEGQSGIRLRDPLFAELFRHAEKIKMKFERTPKGVRVVETSADKYVAELIRAHAKTVSGFAKYGFEEAHKTHPVPGMPSSEASSLHSGKEMKDMLFVEFDRVFIPALALTNQEQQVPAAWAVERLSTAWDERFVDHFHQMFDSDPEWPRSLSQIAQAIAVAKADLESGDTKKAHETLEPIRDILMDARRRNEFGYPLDSLSQFHATMEAIVKPAMQLKAESLNDTQIAHFSKLAQQAEREWAQVEQTTFDLDALGKSKGQQAMFPAMLRAERNAIDELVSALAQGNEELILRSARGLKPPFAKLYMFFGDFPRRVTTTEPQAP